MHSLDDPRGIGGIQGVVFPDVLSPVSGVFGRAFSPGEGNLRRKRVLSVNTLLFFTHK